MMGVAPRDDTITTRGDGIGRLLSLLVAPLLAAALVLAPSTQAKADDDVQAWLAEQQAPLQTATERRDARQTALQRKQALHKRLTEQIEGLRERGVSGYRLEALQRHARSLSEEVRELQGKLASAQTELARAVGVVRTSTRARLEELEKQSPEETQRRRAWIAEQQLLLGLLRTVEPRASVAPLVPEVPNAQGAPTDGPDELRELADELADVREGFLTHAEALRRRIETLQEQQRLVKLAADLEREEGLFDESFRYRTTGRTRVVRRPAAGGAQGEGKEGESEDPPAGASGAASGQGEQGGQGGEAIAEQPQPGPDGDDSDGTPDDGTRGGGGWGEGRDEDPAPPAVPADGEGGYNDHAAAEQDPGDDDGDSADMPGNGSFLGGELSGDVAAADQPGMAGDGDVMRGAPVDGTGGGMVEELQVDLHEDLDPNLGIAGPSSLDGLDVATQLRVLKTRQRKAEEKARRLRRRLEELRSRASELERKEGW